MQLILITVSYISICVRMKPSEESSSCSSFSGLVTSACDGEESSGTKSRSEASKEFLIICLASTSSVGKVDSKRFLGNISGIILTYVDEGDLTKKRHNTWMNMNRNVPQHAVIYGLLTRIQCLCEAYLWSALREGGSPKRWRQVSLLKSYRNFKLIQFYLKLLYMRTNLCRLYRRRRMVGGSAAVAGWNVGWDLEKVEGEHSGAAAERSTSTVLYTSPGLLWT